MTQWKDATNWEMQLPGAEGGMALSREGNIVRFHPGGGVDETVELKTPPDVGPAHAELDRQFAATASRYPVFSANLRRRKRVTYLLLGIFLLQPIIFALYKRAHGPFLTPLRYLTVICWIVGGVWLVCFFF
jgi:hypothetical protein